MTIYVGATSATLVRAGQLYRLSFRNQFNPLSLTFWESWEKAVARFVDKLPGGGFGFVIGTPVVQSAPQVPQWQEVCVAVVRVATNVAAGTGGEVALGDWAARIHAAFPNTELSKVEKVSGAVIGADDSAIALETAAGEAEASGVGAWFADLFGGVKVAAGTVLVLGFLVLLVYMGVLGKNLRRPA